MTLSTNTIEAINHYAKANKCSREKLSAFVEQILQDEKISAVNKPVKQCSGRVGRPVSEEGIRVRSALKECKQEFINKPFLVKSLAQRLNTDVVTLNNQLNWLSKKEGMFVKHGKADSMGRGRRQVIWMAV
ncbi:MAG: hypothetical protein [Myoviridae sp. ctThM1]|nr:MAG: hypothetical protein [Myoviridae sp. ctThM1]